ncbi:3-hydroxyacyl-CoA dehydrogenase family protein [Alkalihalophilus marmarensis]|jgi:3-hydroxybutyryl-CoA dehydrogenase|uniref:L-gulonate 3-dehydrogenase n=1 Tax=Alkalihalophilus marmarensis DSM 21297 TaxID=1188261 RepID=U6SIH5_9BACI|nr:3-hydroxyacyl-CoA dehydrogenase family protein [Alkalihalophilus marmarensis]ERN51182.1 hypothetical protein A33I_20800 [Alkalihalophilus marmarensis DSM 21297]MCM3488475.1 3-hydroxyacyl-CoA dehydrogenase family protein [Alkalihalophilus marmarensis]
MFEKVAVIGAGTLGCGIALSFAMHGHQTILSDISSESLAIANKKSEQILAFFEREGYPLVGSQKEILARLSFISDLEEVADCDFVTECIVEDLSSKQLLFQQLDQLCKPDTILATNTSSLRLSDIIERVTRHRSRILLTHWFNPPHIVPLVELLKGKETSEEVYEQVKQFLEEQNKVTINVKKEVAGLVANRIQIAMAREVLALWSEGVATASDLDVAITSGPGFRLATSGLLEIIDFGGADVWARVLEQLQPKIESSKTVNPQLLEQVETGKYGVKTGEGFFQYPGKSFDEYALDRDTKLLRQLLQVISVKEDSR